MLLLLLLTFQVCNGICTLAQLVKSLSLSLRMDVSIDGMDKYVTILVCMCACISSQCNGCLEMFSKVKYFYAFCACLRIHSNPIFFLLLLVLF